jgi:N-acetylglucosamine-6-sulfatase
MHEEAGYAVGLFGKFVNNVADPWGQAPQGFDAWMANGGGDYLNPAFGVKNLRAFSGVEDGDHVVFQGEYTTAVVGNMSSAWIRHVHATRPSAPFFAYVAPKAVHEPFNPAPWYAEHWDPSWPKREPRPPNVWNATAADRADHHGNIATQPMLTAEAAEVITGVFRNRWRCLLSVDDVIEAVVSTVDSIGELDQTYFFYTSDHGFQLGEFNMLMDKRHVYDFDTRVHLLVRGPHILPGSTWSQPATFVDLAPTFMDIAGLPIPTQFDGKSLLPLLHGEADSAMRSAWRTSVVLEHYYTAPNVKCVRNCTLSKVGDYPNSDEACVHLEAKQGCWGGNACNVDCYATESNANNWRALRDLSDDFLYAEFQTGDQGQSDIAFDAPDFYELYNMSADPWSLQNLHKTTPQPRLDEMRKRLQAWYECAGSACP